MSRFLRVAHCVPCTDAEGPGRRFALWLAGCSLRCPGCCNPELFDARAGARTTIASISKRIERAHEQLQIEGITVLGGEPLEQLPALASLCELVSAAGLGVIVYTGYTYEQARARHDFARLWSAIDTLVDGRFDAGRPEPPAGAGGRRWIGSANQRLWHRSSRYADLELWRGANHAELRIAPDGTLSAHGFPIDVDRLLRHIATR